MIEVKAENGVVRLTFPTDGMAADEVNDFVIWLRAESIARRSKLTESAAWRLSEDIKGDWWRRNGPRFGDPGAL